MLRTAPSKRKSAKDGGVYGAARGKPGHGQAGNARPEAGGDPPQGTESDAGGGDWGVPCMCQGRGGCKQLDGETGVNARLRVECCDFVSDVLRKLQLPGRRRRSLPVLSFMFKKKKIFPTSNYAWVSELLR